MGFIFCSAANHTQDFAADLKDIRVAPVANGPCWCFENRTVCWVLLPSEHVARLCGGNPLLEVLGAAVGLVDLGVECFWLFGVYPLIPDAAGEAVRLNVLPIMGVLDG